MTMAAECCYAHMENCDYQGLPQLFQIQLKSRKYKQVCAGCREWLKDQHGASDVRAPPIPVNPLRAIVDSDMAPPPPPPPLRAIVDNVAPKAPPLQLSVSTRQAPQVAPPPGLANQAPQAQPARADDTVVEGLHRQIEILVGRVAALEALNVSLTARVADLEEKNLTVADLESKLASMCARIEDEQTQVKDVVTQTLASGTDGRDGAQSVSDVDNTWDVLLS